MANVDVFIKRDFESFSFFSKSENTTLSIANDISHIIASLTSGKHIISLIGGQGSGKSTIANAIGNTLSQKNADKRQGDFGFSWSVWENEDSTTRRIDVAGHLEELPDSDSDNGFDLLEHATAEQQKASILVFEISRNSANSTIDFKKEIPTEIRIYINPNILNYERIKKNLSFLSQEYPKPVLSVIPISPAFKL